jgi:hypothetical protein
MLNLLGRRGNWVEASQMSFHPAPAERQGSRKEFLFAECALEISKKLPDFLRRKISKKSLGFLRRKKGQSERRRE